MRRASRSTPRKVNFLNVRLLPCTAVVASPAILTVVEKGFSFGERALMERRSGEETSGQREGRRKLMDLGGS